MMHHSELDPSAPFTHEEFKEFSKFLIQAWNDFLNYIRESIQDGRLISLIQSSKGEHRISPLFATETADQKIQERMRDIISVYGEFDVSETFHRHFTMGSFDISYRHDKTFTSRHIYVTPTKDESLIDLYIDLMKCADHLKVFLYEWEFQNNHLNDRFQTSFSPILYAPYGPDYKEIFPIFSDNITTILHVFSMLIGDAQNLDKDTAIAYLHRLSIQKPINPTHHHYPSLNILSLFGLWNFAVLGRLSSRGMIMKYPQADIEATIKSIESFTILRQDSKYWHDCPALPIIPETFEVFLTVLSTAFPEKYGRVTQ